MSDKPPSGIIILSHPEQIGATPKEMLDALPEACRGVPPLIVELDMAEIARRAVRSRDWGEAQRELEQQFRAKVEPLREKHPDYRIVYFGSSPVPLAIHLGFLLETWQQMEGIPHHHSERIWGWIPEPGKPEARLVPPSLPDYKDRTPGEAIIRVSTSHRVDPLLTREAVPGALVQIDLALEHPAEDVFNGVEEMQEVARAFRRALDVIGDDFPGVERVHVFASVQPGMALLLGAQISKTMHPPVQTYQYARNAEDAPQHVPAVLINGPSRAEPPPLTSDEVVQAGCDRQLLAKDLERMKGLAHQEQRNQVSSWIASVSSKPQERSELTGRWCDLPPLRDTPLPRTTVDLATRAVEDTFRLSPSNEWQIDDHWLARLACRLPTEERRHRALRMLVLHESVHRGPQTLTRTSSRGIGRFPKVLEEMDYHADVWAMLYEHALTALHTPAEIADPQRFFMDLILVATQTMWAFDDDGPLLRQIQVRRLNRYLIWYWQYLLLERGTGRGEAMTLDAVLALLARRPVLELAGPTVLAHSERVFFALDTNHVSVPELAIYHEGRLFRHGTRVDFSITALLEGVRARDGDKILDVLRAAAEPTAR